jgi:hypothetical protein
MNWKAKRILGVMPPQVEVVWDRGDGFFTVVAERVCPHIPGDMVEKERNKVAAIIENAPAMLALLQDIANPKRGSHAEKWTIHNAALHAQEIIDKIQSTVVV